MRSTTGPVLKHLRSPTRICSLPGTTSPFQFQFRNMTDSASSSSLPPPISHVLETCLYVRSLPTSVEFYQNTFNVEPFMNTACIPRRSILNSLSCFPWHILFLE